MNKPTILLATGFVDGRGGSKMCFWFYEEMIARGYKVIVATNSMYKYKLDELKLKSNIVIELNPEDSKKTIYKKCAECLNNVHFDYMVSIGWRTYWPYVAFKRKIPYIFVDGGIPTSFGKYPTEFIKEVYVNTKLFLMTTWFPWEAPKNSLIPNIKIVTQPYPYTRVEKLGLLRNKSKEYCRQLLKNKLPILKTKKFDLFIYLNLSDAYVDPFNHYPNNLNFTDLYNHKMCDYMDFKEIEPSLFFLFNLIAGLETNYQGNVLLYLMQPKTKLISQPIVDMCKKVKTIAPKYLDLNLDPIFKKAADINICRATNCDNQADLSLIGEPCVTSVVPRNYMDEDTAAVQAEKMGVCYQIKYDDPKYIAKLINYSKSKQRLNAQSKKTIQTFENFWTMNNFWTELFKIIK